jgi:DNA-directed RNA polymerase subunit RPC12/RpoP
MGDDVCPDCGGELRFEEKYTVSGQDWREYRCVKCGKSVSEDHGTALWQILHDDRQEQLAQAKAKKRWWRFWKR